MTDYVLLTKTPSRLNLTGFQPGLDWPSDAQFWSPKPKKGEVKAPQPRNSRFYWIWGDFEHIKFTLPLETQKTHYESYITSRDDWQFAGIYYDEGISGTGKSRRPELERLMQDCKAGNIDMVITKSISRFARNTLNCLKYIRLLKGKNIAVWFEKESINTMDSKGEVLITIMTSLAQQESQSLSQNVKLGLQYRYQQGKVQVNHNHFLGYTKDSDGHLVIDPEQAEVVKRIYREYLEGLSMKKIAFNRILTDSDGFIRQMQENIAKAIMDADTMSPDGIQARLDELQKKLIRKANSKPDYDAIADEIFRLREQKSQAEADTRSREETQKRIAELQDFIGSQQSEITEFDESLVRKLIQQITVYDDRFTVRFKSGLEIDFNRYDL